MNTENKLYNNRLKSLDALRGLIMFFLIGMGSIFRSLPKISNNTIFKWLSDQSHHPDWQGFTAWDLIFPLFIFIMGVAMPFSFTKRINKTGQKRQLYKHIIIRSISLTVIGIILWQQPTGAHPHYGYYHILYRIAFSYFFASIILMNSTTKQQMYWALCLFIGHWVLLRFVPVPNFGIGDFSKDGNMNVYIESLVANFISPNFRFMLSPSLIPSTATALLGVLSGHLLLSNKDQKEKTLKLLLAGSSLVVFALIVHFDFPINKKLASPSFTLLAGGISVISLALFYWIIDVKDFTRWAFFLIVVGANSIAIYIITSLINFNVIANVFVGGLDFGKAQTLAVAITATTIAWLLLYYLYKQKIFLKI